MNEPRSRPHGTEGLTLSALAFALLLLLAWLNPTHHPPWAGFHSELPAAVAGLLLTGTTAWRLRSTPLPVPRSAMVLAVVAVIPAAQWMLGMLAYRGDLFLSLVYLVAAAVCIVIGAATALERDSPSLTDVLAWTLLVAAIGSTAIALQQWFGQADWSEWIAEGWSGARANANVGQANHFATLLLWAMLAAMYLRSQGRFTGATLGLVLAFLAIGLALSQSRTTWLTVVVLSMWVALRRRALWKPLAIRASLLIPLIPWYAFLFWASLALPVPLLLESAIDSGGRLEVGGRPLIWSQMVESIRLEPLTGYGWLQGQTAQAAAAVTVPGREFSTYSHNVVLDLIVWNGLPLGLLLSTLLALWYFRVGTRAEGAADFFRFGALTVFAVHSMLEYPFAYLYMLIPAALLAGQLERRSSEGGVSWVSAKVSRATLLACVAVCTLASAALLRDYLLAETDRREVQMVRVRIGGVRPFPPVPDLWVLDQLKAVSLWARNSVGAAMPARDIDELLRVTRRFPSIHFLRTSSAMLALNGREEEALVEMRRLRGLYGQKQFQASVAWMNEAAAENGWPIRTFLAKVEALR